MKRSAEDIRAHFLFSVEPISKPGQQCQCLKLVNSVQIKQDYQYIFETIVFAHQYSNKNK